MAVLCGIDFSDNSRAALRRAAYLAGSTDDDLTVVHSVAQADEDAIWRHFVETPWEVPDKMRKAARGRLESFVQETLDTGTTPANITYQVELDSAADGLLTHERDGEFDWVVLGSTGAGRVANFLLGSTAERVVRESRTPVLAVPPERDPQPEYTRILVPTDFSSDSREAMARAIELARQHNAALDVLHAFTFPASGVALLDMRATPESMEAFEEQRWTDFESFLDDFDLDGLEVSENLRLGSPFSAIESHLDQADVDLICIGTRGRSGLRRMVLGSVTAKVLRTMPCEVLAVRGRAEDVSQGSHQ